MERRFGFCSHWYPQVFWDFSTCTNPLELTGKSVERVRPPERRLSATAKNNALQSSMVAV